MPTILLLPILHLRLLPIRLLLRISLRIHLHGKAHYPILLSGWFKPLDSSTVVKPEPTLGQTQVLHPRFCTFFGRGEIVY